MTRQEINRESLILLYRSLLDESEFEGEELELLYRLWVRLYESVHCVSNITSYHDFAARYHQLHGKEAPQKHE